MTKNNYQEEGTWKEEKEESVEKNKKEKKLFSPKRTKKYTVKSVSQNRVIVIDELGNGGRLPFLGNEHLKVGDQIELTE